MRIQVIHNKHNLFCPWIPIIQKIFDLYRPIYFRPALSNLNIPFSPKRFQKHEHIRDSMTLIFIIITYRYAGFVLPWLTSLLGQLFGCFIHTDQRKIRIIGSSVNIKNIFHSTDKGSIRLRRYTPLTLQPRFKFVFFKVCRTASYERLST
jgi:hypothetical protein